MSTKSDLEAAGWVCVMRGGDVLWDNDSVWDSLCPMPEWAAEELQECVDDGYVKAGWRPIEIDRMAGRIWWEHDDLQEEIGEKRCQTAEMKRVNQWWVDQRAG